MNGNTSVLDVAKLLLYGVYAGLIWTALLLGESCYDASRRWYYVFAEEEF